MFCSTLRNLLFSTLFGQSIPCLRSQAVDVSVKDKTTSGKIVNKCLAQMCLGNA